jgi:hypothetical protein
MVWVLIEKSGIRMRYPTALTFHMSYAPTQPSTAHSLAEAAFSQVWIRFIQKEFTAPQKYSSIYFFITAFTVLNLIYHP